MEIQRCENGQGIGNNFNLMSSFSFLLRLVENYSSSIFKCVINSYPALTFILRVAEKAGKIILDAKLVPETAYVALMDKTANSQWLSKSEA